jgi:hypothetical protein
MASESFQKAIDKLTSLFGAPSQTTIGAAVFTTTQQNTVQAPSTSQGSQTCDEQLEAFAKDKYEYFAGNAWKNFGPEQWLATWTRLYERKEHAQADILKELEQIQEPATNLAASQVTENHDQPDAAREALQKAFDSEEVQTLQLYQIGDTEAITGVLIAAATADLYIALVFLMD